MPTTDSFTSTASAVTSGTQTLTDVVMGSDAVGHVQYTPLGFRVATYAGKVQITKASSFGGTQAALSPPYTVEQARDLLLGLQNVDT